MNDARSETPPKTLIVVATYNEIENLPILVEQVQRYLPQADLLIIDDGSPDGTGDWCDSRAAEDSRLSCLHRPRKSGLGSATITGLRHAIDHGYTIVATMDADLSHPPESLPELLSSIGPAEPDTPSSKAPRADVAIGSRYVPGGRIEGWPLSRRIMSRLVNAYARAALRLKTRDCSGAFRAYRVALLRDLPPEAVTSRGYAYLEELLWRLKRQGARFAEVPITFRDREFGQTKINLAEAFAALWTIARYGGQEWLGRLGPRRGDPGGK